MDPEFKAAVDDLNRAWNEMKTVLAAAEAERKSRGAVSGETDAKLDELNARIDEIEAKAKRPAPTEDNHAAERRPVDPTRKAAYRQYLRKGLDGVSAEERKALIIGDDTTGGYLATTDDEREILKGITEVSPIRQYAKVRKTGKRSVRQRRRTGRIAARWAGELDSKSETTGLKYTMDEVPSHELYADVPISNDDLEDTDYDLEVELNEEFADQFGLAEGIGFVRGTGTKQPEGFLSPTAGIEIIKNGHTTDLKHDGIIDWLHSLKAGYARTGIIFLNRRTLGACRKMKNANGDPLWTPLAAGAPATIAGERYEQIPDMPDIASGAIPMAWGDWKRGYLIVDRLSVQVLRDPFTQAKQGVVEFIARKRVGGQVLLPEAIKLLKMAA